MSYLHDKDWIAEIGLMSPSGQVIATLFRKDFFYRHEADLEISMALMVFSCYGQVVTRVYNKRDLGSNLIFWPR